ncbi:MAG: hypothetical protein MUE42_14355, partial [Opitutaceae bacterium]|nr:hypothetical protein [Opitutaceae bacterium]
MNPAPPRTGKNAFTRFHTKLLIAMMLVVSLITALGVVFAERNAAANLEATLRQEFVSDLAALHHRREIRRAALVERCRALVHYPRIHAALEDNALDLLYPTAHDELRDLTAPAPADAPASTFLHARFYRFLDRTGAVIPPGDTTGVGELSAGEESRLSLPAPPDRPQSGYLAQQTAPGDTRISEIIAMPIFSHENGELIAALVLGFEPYQNANTAGRHGLKNGLWFENHLHLPGLSEAARTQIAAEVARAVAAQPFAGDETHLPISLEGVPHLLFYKTLNAASLFPRAYEISLYSLTA